MSTRKVVRAIFVCLSMVFLVAASSIAGETINFGIGKVLDSSVVPYNGTYEQDKPRLFLETIGTQMTVYAVWIENDDYGTSSHIAFSVSSDLGQTWSQKLTTLEQSSSGNIFAAVTDGAGNLYVVVNNLDVQGGFRHAVFYSSSGQWIEGEPVETGTTYGEFSLQVDSYGIPYLIAGGLIYRYEYGTWTETGQYPGAVASSCIDDVDKMYVFYESGGRVAYRSSFQQYSSWEDETFIPEAYASNDGIFANVSPAGNVDVIWKNSGHIYFYRLPANGVPSSPVDIAQPMVETGGGIDHIRIIYGENDDIYVVAKWEPYWNYACYESDYIIRSSDGGVSFGKPFRMEWGDYNAECADRPDTISTTDANGNTVFVHVWQDDREYANTDMIPNPHHVVYTARGRLYEQDANLLLVDDDYSETPGTSIGLWYKKFFFNSNNYHNYEAWYIDALFMCGIPFDYFDQAGYGRNPGLQYFKKYDTVIWETGLEYTGGIDDANDSLNQAEQDLLSAYLDWGGRLFLCSQDFLRDVTGGLDGAVYNSFANDYLSVTDVINSFDDGGKYYGVTGDPIGDGLTINTSDVIGYINPITGLYTFDFISAISTDRITHNADTIFKYSNKPVALKKSVDPYSLVFMGFPFSSIDQWNVSQPDFNDNSREEVMGRIIGWLNGAQGFLLSNNEKGDTKDSYFTHDDTLNVLAWSDRVDINNIVSAKAELEKPTGEVTTIALVYNSTTGRFRGEKTLTFEPTGTWKVNRVTLEDNQGNRYEVNDRYFDLEARVETVGLNTRWAPLSSPYTINVKVTDVAERTLSVDAYYYYFVDGTMTMSSSPFDTVVVNTAGGVGYGSVTFDFDGPEFQYGQEYGIYLEARDGSTVAAYAFSDGSIATMSTVNRSFPGYSNLHWARYGRPGADSDGDGDSNYYEVFSDTDPADPLSVIEPPVSVITSPADGAALTGSEYIITGTVSGNVYGMWKVEVSMDGGNSWNPASGTNNWSFTWTLPANGNYKIMSRAFDNASNVERPFEQGRVSVNSSNNEANGGSFKASLSADGRYVVFGSWASNLVPNDNNNADDIFVFDRQTGQTECVSVDSSGLLGNDYSNNPDISADGRYVAYASFATNLVLGDTNGTSDIFVYDRLNQVTERVTQSSDTYGWSDHPSISSDGRYVAFESSAVYLVANDTNGAQDVFVYDRQEDTMVRVSVDSTAAQGNGDSGSVSITPDGRYVTFESAAGNLVGGDTNGVYDVFVHDMQTGTTERVSVPDASGVQANGESYAGNGSISADGRYVAFESEASNLVAADANGFLDVFVRDRQAGTTVLASVDVTGTSGGNNGSFLPSISSDGRYVAFESFATDLVTGDTNGVMDVFVRDLLTGTTKRVSVDSSGAQGDGESRYTYVSGDGRHVALCSRATNLVSGDTNDNGDIFVYSEKESVTVTVGN